MASGCLIVGSDTAPVRKIIRNKESGLLVDFFKPDEISMRVMQGLVEQMVFSELKEVASITALKYSFEHGDN